MPSRVVIFWFESFWKMVHISWKVVTHITQQRWPRIIISRSNFNSLFCYAGLPQQFLRALQNEIVSSKAVGLEEDFMSEDFQTNSSGCSCIGYNCGCCAHIELDKIKLNDTVCANFSYLPAPEYGLSFTLTVDNKTWINKTVSLKNPPPLCVAVPYLKIAEVCIEFKNVTFTNSSVSACIYIEATLEGVFVGEKKLGCFTIPLRGKQNFKGMRPKPKNNEYLYLSPVKSLKSLARQNQFGKKGTRFFGPWGYMYC